jgi:hypothetical protein
MEQELAFRLQEDRITYLDRDNARDLLFRLVPGALDLARKHGIKTTILRVKFSVKFDHGELYEVTSNPDVRVVNNLPHGTLS